MIAPTMHQPSCPISDGLCSITVIVQVFNAMHKAFFWFLHKPAPSAQTTEADFAQSCTHRTPQVLRTFPGHGGGRPERYDRTEATARRLKAGAG
jgi:hypothetical protein